MINYEHYDKSVWDTIVPFVSTSRPGFDRAVKAVELTIKQKNGEIDMLFWYATLPNDSPYRRTEQDIIDAVIRSSGQPQEYIEQNCRSWISNEWRFTIGILYKRAKGEPKEI